MLGNRPGSDPPQLVNNPRRSFECPVRVEPCLEEFDRTAMSERHDVEAEILQPCLDFACARGISEHPGATQHCDQNILTRTATSNARRPPQRPSRLEDAGEFAQCG